MSSSAKKLQKEQVPRAERRAAYLVAFVRRFRYLPFFRVDVQIVDISEQGLKLQFPTDVKAKSGSRFWLEIPRALIAAGASGSQFFHAQCRWYNSREATLGATFDAEDELGQEVMRLLLQQLKAAGRMPT